MLKFINEKQENAAPDSINEFLGFSNSSNKKYTLLKNDTIQFHGKKLYRIQALRNIGKINKDTYGGYVESEKNLSFNDLAWIYDDAIVYQNAIVKDSACVYENAIVYGNAIISDKAIISDQAQIYGDAIISGAAEISGNASIYGNAKVTDSAKVYGKSSVSSKAVVKDYAEVYGRAWVGGAALIDSTKKLNNGTHNGN